MIRPVSLSLLVIALAAGCGGHPSKSECDQVVDRMLDIFTAPPATEGSPAAEVTQATAEWRKMLKEKDRDPTRATLLDVCGKQMTTAAADCALTATDDASLAKCFGG